MAYKIRYPLARLSPAKQELIVVEFARRHVEAGNIQPMLEILSDMVNTKEMAERFEGRLTFFFSGWDEDPRETAEIPEIRTWFGNLNEEFPYWFHFIEKEGETLFHVLRLLCDGEYFRGVEDGMVGWGFDDMGQFSTKVMQLFGHMNELHDRLGLPEEMNMRITQEISQLIECTLQ